MRKKFIAVFIAVTLFSAVPVHASEYSDVIGDLMELIESEYVGEKVTYDELYEAALYGMSVLLDDYSGYMSEDTLNDFTDDMSGRLFGIGVTVRLTAENTPEVVRAYDDSPAQKAGLLHGDIIISVNGVGTAGKTLDEVIALIGDPERETAIIEYSRDGKITTVEITKEEIKSVTVYTDRLENLTGEPADDIRYINMSSFSETTAADLQSAIDKIKSEGVKKVILDLRLNLGGRLDAADEICNMLVPSGPAYHTVNRQGKRYTQFSNLKELPFEKVILLVDRNTASAAELLAAAMQDAGSAIVIGETTYGKGVVQTVFMLPTGGAFKLTTEEYFRRSGEQVNHIGVIPDHAVATGVINYETPDDLMLLKAVELLSE